MVLLIHVSEWGKRSNMKKENLNNDFDLVNLPVEAQDPEIKAEDFTLQQADGSIHEQKFQTKPTTFLKDSLKRFRKNKSSVVAAYILGALVLLSIFVPIFNKNDVVNAADASYNNLQPKLFDSGFGWWDGTKHITDCPIDAATGRPDPEIYLEGGVTNLTTPVEKYTNTINRYGKEGYVQVGYYSTAKRKEAYLSTFNSKNLHPDNYFKLDLSNVTLTVTKFDTMNLEKITRYEGNRKKNYSLPENFDLGEISLDFVLVTSEKEFAVPVIEAKTVHNIGLDPALYEDTDPVVINDAILSDPYISSLPDEQKYALDDFYFRFTIKRGSEPANYENVCSLIRALTITPTFATEGTSNMAIIKYFSEETDNRGLGGISFTNPMQMLYRVSRYTTSSEAIVNTGYWGVGDEINYVRRVYLGRTLFADFDYDTYLATLGPRMWEVQSSDFQHYKKKKWVKYNFPYKKEFDPETGKSEWKIDTNPSKGYIPFSITALGKKECPVLETFKVENVVVDQSAEGGNRTWKVNVKVLYYKYKDESLKKMPKFLFGTDKNGKDMFKYVFDGLKNSLLLGVITFVVCFLFGLLWGSISGYFGGAVDLIMERFTDILSGIPWIVVMTLIILKAGESSFGVFALALCLTGWIGTASTTRTQFYRFRGREYVLASRTLGASDARLIARHILPNSLGTIITGAVLMIPSVIFSEATISYLGLGFKNLSSLGVILSNNQAELTNHPYQLIFPSVVIALVMISFNLFGNGLRDAINPSLKGEDE